MYASPPVLRTEVFATYPASLQTGDEHSSWSLAQPGKHIFKSFLEGPSFDKSGVLWCVDIVNGRLLNIDKAGVFSVAAEYDGWPNGLKIREDGLVFIADYKHGIMIHEPGSAIIKPLLERAGVERFKGVNDLFFARNGDLYFTDQGLTGLQDATGRLFRMTPSGRIDCILNAVPSPNGLVMNLDEDALLLAVTRANAIWRVPLAGYGAAKVGNFIQLSGGVGPDGLALDSEGGLWVAHAGLGSVWGFDAIGEPLARVKVPSGLLTTNLAFACDGSTDLYVIESSTATIHRVNAAVAGKTMASHS
ncbi:SMP-30/gluconolactonase/LRE family protein [Pseudomonas fluorescens]|uniref:SMP-30/gluconolactonase/LRE family protein n=1 Tax=Pseudomonas fluorescens TaxID=294 RepID=UPI001781086C|nr:SMP-30/gluconolactonase/LRE family protein [Pseudomonas fluorescens]MBD8235897.1 SMP-30/gluconolactonase/LRE family protein [Pseudomonas fluorescens]MDY0894887.1 SMP-30/gluconolactonase/LRE family protein [Pseudomonas fluorescens]